jgi:hypothetical protein
VDEFASEVEEDEGDKTIQSLSQSKVLIADSGLAIDSTDKHQLALKSSIQKIETHLQLAQTALARHQDHSNQLKDSVKAAKGVAKRELKKLLQTSEKHVSFLETHVKEGMKELDRMMNELKQLYQSNQASHQSASTNLTNPPSVSQVQQCHEEPPKVIIKEVIKEVYKPSINESFVQKVVGEKTEEMRKKYEAKVAELEQSMQQMQSEMDAQINQKQKEMQKNQKTLLEEEKEKLETSSKKYD